jgi:hypothetical protein
MKLIKNKINGDIVYRSDVYCDILTIYNINLKHNFPDSNISDYEILDINDEEQIGKINNSAKIKYKDGKFEFTTITKEINYESQIDKMTQLQCQILMMQDKINKLTEKVNKL